MDNGCSGWREQRPFISPCHTEYNYSWDKSGQEILEMAASDDADDPYCFSLYAKMVLFLKNSPGEYEEAAYNEVPFSEVKHVLNISYGFDEECYIQRNGEVSTWLDQGALIVHFQILVPFWLAGHADGQRPRAVVEVTRIPIYLERLSQTFLDRVGWSIPLHDKLLGIAEKHHNEIQGLQFIVDATVEGFIDEPE